MRVGALNGDLNGFAKRYVQTCGFNKTDFARLSGVSRSD
jgi:hypothetical protein